MIYHSAVKVIISVPESSMNNCFKAIHTVRYYFISEQLFFFEKKKTISNGDEDLEN